MSFLARLRAFLGLGRSAAPPAPAEALPIGAIPVHAVGDPAPTAPPPDQAWQLRAIAVDLTERDVARLAGVHPDLIRVVIRARAATPFLVAEGVRTAERQAEMVRAGKSKTMNSRHLTGHAVDLYPISKTPIPQMARAEYVPVVQAMARAAKAEGVRMEHGHNWGWDSPHHELHREAYP